MKSKPYWALIFCLIIGLGTVSGAFAQSGNNFSISPPPIPWFEFQADQQDLRVGATFFSVTGKDNPDLSIFGAGGNFIYRAAFSDLVAIDVGAVLFGASGDVAADSSVSMFIYNPTLNLELQLIKSESVCMILFGGGNIGVMRMNITSTMGGSTDAAILTYGPQAGLQVSLKLGDLTLSPFFMWQYFKGTASVTAGGYTTSMDIPSYTMNTFGIDIVYVPWNITLSSMLQLKPSSDDAVNVFIFSVSYDFRWDGPGETAKK